MDLFRNFRAVHALCLCKDLSVNTSEEMLCVSQAYQSRDITHVVFIKDLYTVLYIYIYT